MNQNAAPTGSSGQSSWPVTHWSQLGRARGASTSSRNEILDGFLGPYWKPLYNHARRLGCSHEDAQDLVQEFLLRILRKEFWSRVHRWKISCRHLIDLPSLSRKLNEKADPISCYLWAQLSTTTQHALGSFQPSNSDPIDRRVLAESLGQDFDRIIRGQSIYDSQRFAQCALQATTLGLAAQNPQGDDLERLNRLLIEEAYPQEISKERVRFRSFILRALTNLVNNFKKVQLEGKVVSLEALSEETGFEPEQELSSSEEADFGREWARSVVAKVLLRLRAEYTESGQTVHFVVFYRARFAVVLGEAFSSELQDLANLGYNLEPATVEEMAQEYQRPRRTISALIVNSRRRFQTMLREEIQDYALSEAEIAQELREICDCFLGRE